MGYRGEDLDLRTPQTWSAVPVDHGGSPLGEALIDSPRGRQGLLGYARGGPIWVDEVVLDCCNQAFDLALAHRAGEVRLEHLIHALTVVDAAIEALEARGIRVAALRREAGLAIAGELPSAATNSKGTPRRSEELEEALRISAQRAYRRHAPVSVDDILHVLLDAAGEGSYGRLRPALQIMRNAHTVEQAEPQLDRGRPYFASERERPARAEPAPAADSRQSSLRLEALEQMVRNLTNDLSNERKALAGVLHDLQRDVMAQREDTIRFGGGAQDKSQSLLGERLQNIEQALFNVRPAAAPDLSLLNERIGALEIALRGELADARRLLNALAARPDPALDLAPVSHRLNVIEEAVLAREVPERLKSVEGTLAEDRSREAEAHAALVSEVQGLASSLEAQKAEITTGVVGPLSDRVEALAAAAEQRGAETSDGFARLKAELVALGEVLDEHARLGEEGQAAYTRELAQMGEALSKLNANQHTLAASIDTFRQENLQAAQTLSAEIEALERATAVPVAMLESLSGTVQKMHKLTVERYYRRNRFWYWLFGTDDWVAASWASQSARIAKELEAVKPQLKP